MKYFFYWVKLVAKSKKEKKKNSKLQKNTNRGIVKPHNQRRFCNFNLIISDFNISISKAHRLLANFY